MSIYLFDKHLNRQGKGIKKHLGGYGKSKKFHKHPLEDVLEGRVDVSHYTVDILKTRLIQEGFLMEQCNCCSFEERRVVDYKVPLVLNFKDKNKNIKNIEVNSQRVKDIFGIHKVTFYNKTKSNYFKHEALSRDVFAQGALFSSKIIVGLEPNIYGFKDILNWSKSFKKVFFYIEYKNF